jgi:hypothetical protein
MEALKEARGHARSKADARVLDADDHVVAARRQTDVDAAAGGVNLMAFDTRFQTICRMRSGSPIMKPIC